MSTNFNELEQISAIFNAKTFKDKTAAFDNACTLCSLYKNSSDCGSCPIRKALLAGINWHTIKDGDDIIWLQKELASV